MSLLPLGLPKGKRRYLDYSEIVAPKVKMKFCATQGVYALRDSYEIVRVCEQFNE